MTKDNSVKGILMVLTKGQEDIEKQLDIIRETFNARLCEIKNGMDEKIDKLSLNIAEYREDMIKNYVTKSDLEKALAPFVKTVWVIVSLIILTLGTAILKLILK